MVYIQLATNIWEGPRTSVPNKVEARKEAMKLILNSPHPITYKANFYETEKSKNPISFMSLAYDRQADGKLIYVNFNEFTKHPKYGWWGKSVGRNGKLKTSGEPTDYLSQDRNGNWHF